MPDCLSFESVASQRMDVSILGFDLGAVWPASTARFGHI